MKNYRVAFFVLLFGSVIFAQSPIDKGTYTIGGSISYSNQSYDDQNSSNNRFLINPQFGYFFLDNIYTGLALNYEHFSMDGVKYDKYGFGPSVRYYFDSKKVMPFLGLAYIFNQTSQMEYKFVSRELKFTFGANYFITDFFALETSINYSFINYNYPLSYYNNGSFKGKLFSIGIGASYYIH